MGVYYIHNSKGGVTSLEQIVEVFQFKLDGKRFSANIIQCEEGGYFAEVVGCEGCMTQAETLEGVKENIRDALTAWLEVLKEEEPQLYKTWRATRSSK